MEKTENKTIRTRFAPSPTGFMHVGGVRTALFAWLIAKQNNGQFILRIEDTDQNREVEGSADHIIRTLNALGLNYDEGPDKPGNYGPYIQSQRLDIYNKWAQKLIESGRAYADPYTKEQLDEFREQARISKQPFLYRNHRPENPPKWDGKTALRFKSDPKSYQWNDEVMGDLKSGPEVIDDFILMKSDGFPTYNFAHIVDDAEMQISHVIRGQEFISSQPNFLNLYEALELKFPVFATLPHILAPSGQKKLSKRDNAKDILNYLSDGYLPETLINFIASMGWNDGTTQEIYSTQELIDKFSLDRVGKSGARFDEDRLVWMNGQHIRNLSTNDLKKAVKDFWPQLANEQTEEQKDQILALVKDRLKTFNDLPTLTSFFFTKPVANLNLITQSKQLKKLQPEEIVNLLTVSRNKLSQTNFTADEIQQALNDLLVETNSKPAVLFSLIRTVITWTPFSPQLNQTMEILGKEQVISLLNEAIDIFSKKSVL